ncbi:MAG TPA: hypothetical protein VNT02_14965 [Burkholderiales bacterium]|nr:hypothetical protein [Burkholderiales bacterium]
MDIGTFVEVGVKVLLGICALLAALAVAFLALRPLLDPQWNEGRRDSGSGAAARDDDHAVHGGTMQGT